jgi:hypothetical protein
MCLQIKRLKNENVAQIPRMNFYGLPPSYLNFFYVAARAFEVPGGGCVRFIRSFPRGNLQRLWIFHDADDGE